jgi:hypothetical protein
MTADLRGRARIKTIANGFDLEDLWRLRLGRSRGLSLI